MIWHEQKSWNGVAILAPGADPVESRRGLPGDPEDIHSRYIEALINGVRVGCLYLPNGNPAPAPKFDHKLRWLERLTKHAEELLATEVDFSVIFSMVAMALVLWIKQDCSLDNKRRWGAQATDSVQTSVRFVSAATIFDTDI